MKNMFKQTAFCLTLLAGAANAQVTPNMIINTNPLDFRGMLFGQALDLSKNFTCVPTSANTSQCKRSGDFMTLGRTKILDLNYTVDQAKLSHVNMVLLLGSKPVVHDIINAKYQSQPDYQEGTVTAWNKGCTKAGVEVVFDETWKREGAQPRQETLIIRHCT